MVSVHGRGCVGFPGLKMERLEIALLLTFLKSPLSRSVGKESRSEESDWPWRANGGGGPPLSLFVSAYCIGVYAVGKILIGPSFGLIGPPNWPL